MALEQSAAPATTSDAGQAVSPVLDEDGGPSPVEVAQLRENVLSAAVNIPERLSYRIKRALLGEPLVTARLHEEKLSKKAALGVLSSDCISSSAYGTEEMLVALVPVFGLASFHILGPMTAVVIGVLILMTLSYREVVMVYTKAGGSYVVARDNFGPRVAQIASVALMIDYIVTVAVQAAAGTLAITSLVPSIEQWNLEITIGLVLVLAYGNLRGVREAGRAFAFPTYLFFFSMTLVIVLGIGREILGDLPQYATDLPGQFPVTNQHDAILSWAAIFVLLKAFANGGSSLTGLEAISNGVSAFQPPAGVNARRTLSLMSLMLGFLVAGVSYLAVQTHAVPYTDGAPTVISQVAKAAFGTSSIGHVGFILVQLATALILYTGANTPFTGFPFLASFVAEDSFLPRQLTRRGHRLAFSNGIIVLTVSAIVLLLGGGRERRSPGAVLRHRRVHWLHDGRPRHGQVSLDTTRAGMATKARDQLRGRHCLAACGGDLRRGEVHRGCLARGNPVPHWVVRSRPSQRSVPRGAARARSDYGRPGGRIPSRTLRTTRRSRLRGSARSRGNSGAAICRQPPPDGDPRGSLNDRQ